MRSYGCSEDEIREALGEPEPEVFEVWQENEETVEMFMAVQTQWRVGAMGGYLGLDYAGASAALGLMVNGRHKRRELFCNLQVMERAALPILNRKQ